jgi:hypothetical protein
MKIKLMIEPGILGTPMHLLRLVKLSELEQRSKRNHLRSRIWRETFENA